MVDRDALAQILATLGDLLVGHPEIGELEINPLRATAEGLVALDAVLLPTTADHDQHRFPEQRSTQR